MVVTGPTIGKTLAPMILKTLDSAGIDYVLFSEVESNPSVNTVNRIQKLYLETGCQGFIAIGGGSSMDAAKRRRSQGCPSELGSRQNGRFAEGGQKLPPFIAVPTTAGTGSETTIAAVITDSDTHHKYAIMDLQLVPLYAVLDPEMTRNLPPKLPQPPAWTR